MSTQPSRSNAQSSPWDYTHCEGTPHCPPRCPRFVDKHGVGMVIRPLEETDRPALEAMYEDYTHADRAQGIPPRTPERREEWLERILEDGRHVVADRDGRIVGHVFYIPAAHPEPELAVFVHPEWHGRGIGTELCRHVVAFARDADREALVLDVERRNRAAIAVYRKLGFERTAEHNRELQMRLALSGSGGERR